MQHAQKISCQTILRTIERIQVEEPSSSSPRQQTQVIPANDLASQKTEDLSHYTNINGNKRKLAPYWPQECETRSQCLRLKRDEAIESPVSGDTITGPIVIDLEEEENIEPKASKEAEAALETIQSLVRRQPCLTRGQLKAAKKIKTEIISELMGGRH